MPLADDPLFVPILTMNRGSDAGTNVCFWHIATSRCDATIRRLSGAKQTRAVNLIGALMGSGHCRFHGAVSPIPPRSAAARAAG